MGKLSEMFYIIGHRGAAGERFENSLEGFRHALRLDIDAIEIDIRETGDELWVIHDHDLQRLTGMPGYFEMQPDPSRLHLRNGEPVPSLRQVLDLTWGKMPLNIEIKSIGRVELLLELLAQYPRIRKKAPGMPWILISSFNHRALRRLRQLGCKWPLAPISSGIPLQLAAELKAIQPWSWHFDNEYLAFDQVARLGKKGVPCFVFTVNDAERARELRARGVAGIFTDLPTKMIKIV